MPTTRAEQRRLQAFSPFEVRDSLIGLAGDERAAGAMLNAGRGNPNWIATEPREAFWLLGKFGMEESRRDWDEWDGVGGMPQKTGIAKRFSAFLQRNRKEPGADLLGRGIDHGVSKLGFDADAWVWELTDSIIGGHYPDPGRMLPHIEKVVKQYLVKEMLAGTPPRGDFDLFATEGGTAAMCYIFDSAIINRILHPGDTIAVMTPILMPYLEIPQLERYRFKIVEVKANRIDQGGLRTWQYEDAEIDKLADPHIKALFLVNPSNPPSVMLPPATVARIKRITETDNPGLAIITDDVYGTFVNGFESLMSTVPRNTIGVYSFSKHFGCTGWRLGVIALSHDNVFEEKLADLPAKDKALLNNRYGSLTLEPEQMRFIDRMVADSRQVALNHTAGLSPPQQVQMALFGLFALLDEHDEYKRTCQSIVASRLHALVNGLGVPLPKIEGAAHYYVELDLMRHIETTQSKEFARWMKDRIEPVDVVFRLAEKAKVVLLPGGDFDDGPEWSARVSLADLRLDAYEQIGDRLREVIQGYLAEFEKSRTGKRTGKKAPVGKAKASAR